VNDHIPRWGLAFRTTEHAKRFSPDIAYQPLIASLPTPVSAACIITRCWNQSPRKFTATDRPERTTGDWLAALDDFRNWLQLGLEARERT